MTDKVYNIQYSLSKSTYVVFGGYAVVLEEDMYKVKASPSRMVLFDSGVFPI